MSDFLASYAVAAGWVALKLALDTYAWQLGLRRSARLDRGVYGGRR